MDLHSKVGRAAVGLAWKTGDPQKQDKLGQLSSNFPQTYLISKIGWDTCYKHKFSYLDPDLLNQNLSEGPGTLHFKVPM